jgi:hypothetical protein
MPHVSLTRLRLRSIRFFPGFAFHTSRSAWQLRTADGFLGGQLCAMDGGRTFWTITLWADEQAMRRYRNTAAHKAAMPKLIDWCDEAGIAHWTQADATLPSPDEALRQMIAIGRQSKVRNPSAGHAAGNMVPDGRPPKPSLTVRPRPRKDLME